MDTALIKQYNTTNKEQQAKSRFFRGTSASNSRTPVKDKKLTEKPSSAFKKSGKAEQIAIVNVPNEQVEHFLHEMEKEVKSMKDSNSYQLCFMWLEPVTLNMIANQNHVLQSQTEILNNNQKNLAEMMKLTKEALSQKAGGAGSSVDNKQLVRELLLPINHQLMEIRNLYAESKELALDANRKANEIKQSKRQTTAESEAMSDALNRYLNSSDMLKEKVELTKRNIEDLLPDNLKRIAGLQNMNLNVFSETIQKLKTQIDQEAERAERDLSLRYQQLKSLPLVEREQALAKEIENIDMNRARDNIQKKLGGSFDYITFQQEVSELVNQVQKIQTDTWQDVQFLGIELPPYQKLDYAKIFDPSQMRSVLDEMKAKILEKNPHAFDEVKPKKATSAAPSVNGPETKYGRTRGDRLDALSDAGSQPNYARPLRREKDSDSASKRQVADINKTEKPNTRSPLKQGWNAVKDPLDESNEEEQYIRKYVEKNVMEEIRDDVEREKVKKLMAASKRNQNDFKYMDPDHPHQNQPKKIVEAVESEILKKLYERSDQMMKDPAGRTLKVPVAETDPRKMDNLREYASPETLDKLGLTRDSDFGQGDPRHLIGQLGKELLAQDLLSAMRPDGGNEPAANPLGMTGANVAQTLADQFLQIINATLGQVNQLVQKSYAVGARYTGPGQPDATSGSIKVLKEKATMKADASQYEKDDILSEDEEEKQTPVLRSGAPPQTASLLQKYNVMQNTGGPFATGGFSQPRTTTFQITGAYDRPPSPVANLTEYYKEIGSDEPSGVNVSSSNAFVIEVSDLS